MPSIQYAHLCEYARIDQSGTVSIIGIFDTIHLAAVPTSFPFLHVITNLRGRRGERFQFFTRLSGPDGTVLQTAPPVEVVIHQEAGSASQINGYLGIVFPGFGDYSVEFVIDGTAVHTIPFRVIPREQPHPQQPG